METIKSVLGYGTKQQEGQEPVSGQQGVGSAVEPFDQGNQENDASLGGKAPQVTDTTEKSSQSTPLGDSIRPHIPTPKPSEQFPTADSQAADATTSSGKPLETSPVNEPSQSAPATNASTTTPAVEASSSEPFADQPTETGGIGSSSWFRTALPFGKSKSAAESKDVPTEQEDATVGTSLSQSENVLHENTSESHKGLPPNQLPADVPQGTSTDLAPPQTPAGVDDKVSESTLPSTATESTPTTTTATATEEPAAPRPAGEPAASELPGTKAPVHESRFSEDDPDVHRGDNPSSIPTAGGKTLGVAATEERKEAGLPADPGPNLPQSAIGNPTPESAAKASDGAASTTSGSSAAKEGEELSKSPEGKHKHNLLHKIKEKIKH